MFDYEKTLTAQLITGLQRYPWRYRSGNFGGGRLGSACADSFVHARPASPDSIARALGEQNIFVWNGHNYGLEPAKALGLLEGGGVVRVGMVHYNTAERNRRNALGNRGRCRLIQVRKKEGRAVRTARPSVRLVSEKLSEDCGRMLQYPLKT